MLKTTNYVSKSTGIVLPQACALLTNLTIEKDNRARAVFSVQSSRESATQFNALDKFEVRFTWDRVADPAKAAYLAAKTEAHEEEIWDKEREEPVKVVHYGPLYGWQDDYV
ncbi:MAG: hypothetical protein IIX02_05490 [Clostridia bacterium]|nr:hypothetical protein [Clostridia bacterium]